VAFFRVLLFPFSRTLSLQQDCSSIFGWDGDDLPLRLKGISFFSFPFFDILPPSSPVEVERAADEYADVLYPIFFGQR